MKRDERSKRDGRTREKKTRLLIRPDGTTREKKPRGRPGRPKKVVAAPPRELVDAITGANEAEGLEAVVTAILLASCKKPGEEGYVEPKVAKVLLDAVKEKRQILMRLKARESAASVVAGAFEILTKQEREVLEAYRASKRVAPLKPGETPPPPPEDEPEKETT